MLGWLIYTCLIVLFFLFLPLIVALSVWVLLKLFAAILLISLFCLILKWIFK